jgi:hypothetical protein
MSNKNEMLYGLCMIALALQLSAISTGHWSVKSLDSYIPNLPKKDGVDVSMGLWKACGEIWAKEGKYSGNMDMCVHLPIDGVKTFPKNSLYAVRAFSIIGVLLIFMGMMCMMYGKGYKRCQLVFLVAGGLSAIIANSIWAAELLKIKPHDGSATIKFNPGYSFYLNLGGAVVALVAAAYHHFGK